MTLPSSFPMSMSDVATELARPLGGNSRLNLGEAEVLALAQKTALPVSMSDLLGKSRFVLTDTDTKTGTRTVSFTNMAFFGNDNSRRIYVTVGWTGNTATSASLSSATIGGVDAVIRGSTSRSHGGSGINIGTAIIYGIPTSHLGTVSLTFSNSDNRSVAIGVFRAVSLLVDEAAVAGGTLEEGAQSVSANVNLFVSGGLLSSGVTRMTGGSTGNLSWTGNVERYEFTESTTRMGGAMNYNMSAALPATITMGNTVPNGQEGLFCLTALSVS
jgi:hypothetical protein